MLQYVDVIFLSRKRVYRYNRLLHVLSTNYTAPDSRASVHFAMVAEVREMISVMKKFSTELLSGIDASNFLPFWFAYVAPFIHKVASTSSTLAKCGAT